MSEKVEVFFETFRIGYEGIDLGANCDLLPSSLVGLIEGWLADWDPRQLRQLATIRFREPVCEHSVFVRKDWTRYLDALAFIRQHPATVMSLSHSFGSAFTQLDIFGKSEAIRNWASSELNVARWDSLSYIWGPLL